MSEAGPRRSTRANKGQHRFADWNMEETAASSDSKPKKRKVTRPAQDSQDNENDEGEIRCNCSATKVDPDDDRPMVECEKCLKWQHVVCMIGVNDAKQLPEPYLCNVCQPREALKSTSEEEEERSKTTKPEHSDSVEDVGEEKSVSPLTSGKRSLDSIDDKVRQSVVTALNRIFSRELVPMAIKEGELPADTDVLDYSEQLALDIEESMYDQLATKGPRVKDVGKDYRAHFRTLSFNLKDNKNHLLQLRIVTRALAPKESASLSTEQMLNPELQKLAESVRQESIRDSVLKTEDAPRMRKTHKGDEVVEASDEEVTPDRASSERESTPVGNTSTQSERNERSRNDSLGEARYDNGPLEEIAFSGGESPQQGFGTSDNDEYEPLDLDLDENDGLLDQDTPSKSAEPVAVWAGQVTMAKVSTLSATAYHVGSAQFTSDLWSTAFDLSKPLVVEGRLSASTASKYLKQVSQTRLIGSFLLAAEENDESRKQIKVLYDYFKSRDKFGVLPNHTAVVKDAYLVPITKAEVPEYLNLDEAQHKMVDSLIGQESYGLLGVYVLPPAASLLQHLGQ